LAAETIRVVESGRLVYYGQSPDVDYWSQHWKTYGHAGPAYEISFGSLQRCFLRYLPLDGRIIEAGCGLGQVVLSMKSQGYEIEGVEWSSETVSFIHSLNPDAPIRVGDVTHLDVPDGYYDGYISLGVVEHRKEGPEPFLREASRVLSSDGVALISVPYFNPVRRAKAWFGVYASAVESDAEFYQYAFTTDEFETLLRSEGLTVIDKVPHGVIKGAKDEIIGLGHFYSVGRKIVRWRRRQEGARGVDSSQPSIRSGPSGVGKLLMKLSMRPPFLFAAHMMLFVCIKNDRACPAS